MKKWIKNFLIIALGNFLLAFSISFCFINYRGIHIYGVDEATGLFKTIQFNGILSGGTSGFSLIIRNLFFLNIENGAMITENIITVATVILFIIGSIFLGKKFALQTLLSTILCPAFLYLFKLNIFSPLHEQFNCFEPVVCAIIGGLFMGVGCGISYRIGGSTGGFDVPGLIINKYTRIKLSVVFLVQDGLLVVLALIANFKLYEIVIGLISVIAYSVAVEYTQKLGNDAYFCDIISDKWEEINKEILALNRGSTIVDVIGGFSNNPKKMIKTMVGKNQYLTIIDIIKRIDPTAFVSMTKTNNVFGEGYKDINDFSNK
ncbi:MAG: YitT family protein [Candidatus Caccosoma sp.]|nr:YitT family protein [Candidatus Caccosoma sp.]